MDIAEELPKEGVVEPKVPALSTRLLAALTLVRRFLKIILYIRRAT